MDRDELAELKVRLRRLEESAINRLIMSYGPAADAGLTTVAGQLCSSDGDSATALNYSLIMRREGDRFYLWRVSAVRWDLTRLESGWRVRRRTNRLLDETGVGRQLFGDALNELFVDAVDT